MTILSGIKNREVLIVVFRGIVLAIVMIISFLYLLNTDGSSVPQFIYNDF